LPLIGQRLTVGAEHRLATGTSGTATVARTTTTATTGTARTATLATITTETTGTTRAARTTRTARTIATWTTAAATRAAAIATAEVTRRGGQLPTDSRARHLAATGTIVFLLLFFLRADLEAAEAARLVAITATAGATAATAGATTTATATSAITAAIIAIVATSARRTGDAIDDVVELAARDRTVRSLLAMEHADETDLIDAVPDDVERFDQPRCAIGLHRELRRERLHDRIILRRGRRRLGHACLGRFGSGLDAFRAFRTFRARFTITTLRRRLGCCLGPWLLLDRRRRRRRSAGHLGTRLRGFAQGQRREFRERLHAG
jgi:hypothetical protein